jgi:hypothetical protein
VISDAVPLVAGFGLSLVSLFLMGARRWMPTAVNYRGKRLLAVLGMAATFAICVHLAASATGYVTVQHKRTGHALWLIPGILLVFAAGLYDDLRPVRVRGVVKQLAMLARGTMSSGAIKLAAAVAAGLMWTLIWRSPPVRVLLGTAVIAGCANVGNLLDVVPGRTLKFFLAVALTLYVVRRSDLLGVSIGSAAALLWFDLRERAMLGDAGANVFGLIAGIALFDRLGTTGLAASLGVILVLHGASETFTLSRIIRRTPPLRWFDALGRIRSADHDQATE